MDNAELEKLIKVWMDGQASRAKKSEAENRWIVEQKGNQV